MAEDEKIVEGAVKYFTTAVSLPNQTKLSWRSRESLKYRRLGNEKHDQSYKQKETFFTWNLKAVLLVLLQHRTRS